MKTLVQRSLGGLGAALAVGGLALALQGCTTTSSAPVDAAAQAANWHDEAARLIRTLDISGHLQDSARDYVSVQIARGVAPKPALQRWIQDQRDRGAVIRCKPEVKPTDECIART